MTITQVAKHVLDNGVVLIRHREGREYDVKPLFTGNKRGWIAIDTQTANVINTVREALADNPKIDKFDAIPLHKLVNFCWKHVR